MGTPPHAFETFNNVDPFLIHETAPPSPPTKQKVTLEGLPAESFRHPLDLAATVSLNKTKGFGTMMKALSSAYYERLQNIKNVSEFVQVGPSQYKDIFERYQHLASVLSVPRVPDLYVMNSPVVNAEALGMQRYSIRVTSALIDVMNDEELDAVLAHELGHVKCDHMRYMTMAALLADFGGVAASFIPIPGVGEALFLSVQLALLEWNRKAEFSCDRAALLAVQDAAPVQSMLGKLAGYSHEKEIPINIDALVEQADQFDEIGADSLFEKALKLYVLMDQTHPYPVVRVREIGQWAKSSQYEAILSKQYDPVTEEMWYVAANGDAVGPMILQDLRDALKSGRYSGKDYVFTAGMSDWVPARTVESLADCCPADGRSHLPKVPDA